MPPGASKEAGCCSGGREYGDCDPPGPDGEDMPVPRPGEGGILRSGELAFRAARAPARVPSLEGWEELSGEWMRRPDGGSCGTAPY